MRSRRWLGFGAKIGLAALVALALATGSAAAEVKEVPLESATNGIAVGPDGSIWVAEQFSGQVARISPAGQVLAQYSVGAEPLGVASGPGGRIWVAVSEADKLVWFDAASPIPSPHNVSTAGVSDCGPVGVVDGGDARIYVSLPSVAGCHAGVSVVGRVAADGSGSVTGETGLGEAYDLAAYGGKLFVPDFGGDAVRRVAPASFTAESTIATPAGAEPAFVAVSPAGEVWTSLSASNQVARFPAAQNGGSATILPAASPLLSQPEGIAFGADGGTYVASYGNSSLVRIDGAGAVGPIALPNAQPFDLAAAADGSIWISDQARARVLRYVPPVAAAPTPPSTPAPPVPAADKTPPAVQLGGKKSQVAAAFVAVTASCPTESCQATATGHLELKLAKGKSKAKSLPLRGARATIPAGGKKVLQLRLPAKAKKAVKPVLASGGTVTAKVELRVSDAAGNPAAPKRISVRLTSAGPR